ncbi:MAG TPA: oxidoreductase [Flavipsychrobacter sp.]|nr:oxidoreductase [Flavipsychrobacter sp.]
MKIWFITGVSSGFGKALVEEIVSKGDMVIGTLRKDSQIETFNNQYNGKALAIKMDVTRIDEIKVGVETIIAKYGQIDVLVNNAGYGLFGAIEEVNEQEARAQMETNFFGALWVTKEVLPVMRQQQSGHIVQISSMAGFRGSPGLGIYNASKYALEGFSEALAQEVAPFNIKVSIVEPGPFRTHWAGNSSQRSEKIIDAYSDTPAGQRIKIIHGYSGKQPGDPDKAAQAILKIVEAPDPPLRIPLGKSAVSVMRDKLSSVEKELLKWEHLALDTDFND